MEPRDQRPRTLRETIKASRGREISAWRRWTATRGRRRKKKRNKKKKKKQKREERGGEARTARVWSINHDVFPATGGHRGRWRGHIIGRIVPVCWSAGRTVIYLVAIDRPSTVRLDSS